MSRRFEVSWAAVAERDLLGIIEFVAAENPDNALGVLKRIERAASKLDGTPERGRIVPELKKQGLSRYRELIVDPLRIIYRVETSAVYVLSVVDGRRNVEDVLLDRLLN